jgi:hypothetical protein
MDTVQIATDHLRDFLEKIVAQTKVKKSISSRIAWATWFSSKLWRELSKNAQNYAG